MFNKYLDNMLYVHLKNNTHAQYHKIIGSQIGRVWKKRFSVQCTVDPKTAATGSCLENCSSSGCVRSFVFIISSQQFTLFE